MELIQVLTAQLGLSTEQATHAAGGAFEALQSAAPAAAFEALRSKVPESAQWMQAAQAKTNASSGLGADLLGGLFGALDTRGVGELLPALLKSGIGTDTAKQIIPILLHFLEERMGKEGMAKLCSAIPLLGSLTSTQGTPGLGNAISSLMGNRFGA